MKPPTPKIRKITNKITQPDPAITPPPCHAHRLRFQKALEALQAQSTCAASMLKKKVTSKDKAPDRERLKSAQQRMTECEPETGLIWNFVMSGRAGKHIPDLTLADLEPLIAEQAKSEPPTASDQPFLRHWPEKFKDHANATDL